MRSKIAIASGALILLLATVAAVYLAGCRQEKAESPDETGFQVYTGKKKAAEVSDAGVDYLMSEVVYYGDFKPDEAETCVRVICVEVRMPHFVYMVVRGKGEQQSLVALGEYDVFTLDITPWDVSEKGSADLLPQEYAWRTIFDVWPERAPTEREKNRQIERRVANLESVWPAGEVRDHWMADFTPPRFWSYGLDNNWFKRNEKVVIFQLDTSGTLRGPTDMQWSGCVTASVDGTLPGYDSVWALARVDIDTLEITPVGID